MLSSKAKSMQKRPTYMAKAIYLYGKETLLWAKRFMMSSKAKRPVNVASSENSACLCACVCARADCVCVSPDTLNTHLPIHTHTYLPTPHLSLSLFLSPHLSLTRTHPLSLPHSSDSGDDICCVTT